MKKNIVIALLLIVSIGSIGYITYDSLLKEENVELKECNKEEICDECICDKEELCDNIDVCQDVSNNYFTNLKKNRDYTTYFSENRHDIELLLAKNGDVYWRPLGSNYSDNLDNKMKDYTFKDYDTVGIGPSSNIYRGFKLNVSNVLMIFDYDYGQAGNHAYIFIKENGNVAIAEFLVEEDNNNNVIDAKVSMFKDNVKGLKNIVAAVESSSTQSHDVDLIDINGNRYDLYEFLN